MMKKKNPKILTQVTKEEESKKKEPKGQHKPSHFCTPLIAPQNDLVIRLHDLLQPTQFWTHNHEQGPYSEQGSC